MNIPTYILKLLTGQYTSAVHIYVCNVSKLPARQYRVSAFPYWFILRWPVRAISIGITFVVNNHIVVVHLRHA